MQHNSPDRSAICGCPTLQGDTTPQNPAPTSHNSPPPPAVHSAAPGPFAHPHDPSPPPQAPTPPPTPRLSDSDRAILHALLNPGIGIGVLLHDTGLSF
ncbi:MAG: hypothetical protein DYG92_02255, partial [Leptolyngbya sp. PLA1]|nr:hypothetical protein [Leptolyngbya sp. PLA1]